MKTVYYGSKIDPDVMREVGSIFLAGPSPREARVQSWRPAAIETLKAFNFEGYVFIPEHDNGMAIPEGQPGMTKQDLWEWEQQALEVAHVIAFWVPREKSTLPGLTTNIEFGMWMTSGKVVFGAPKMAEDVGYMRYVCEKQNIKQADTLHGTMHLAVLANVLGLTARRSAPNMKYIPAASG